MKTNFNLKLTFNLKLIIAALVFSAFILTVGLISNDMGVLGTSIILSVFSVGGSIFLINYLKYMGIKEMEQRFPFFLRDLIESIRSGVPFHVAVMISSKYDYGKLSQEVKKMANQISWGIPFEDVIEKFIERMKNSKRIVTALKIIKETYLSGGDVVNTLESVSDTMNILEESEKEKKSLIGQYVILMYAINFLFVGIVIGINRFMVPIFQTASTTGGMQAMGLSNPCSGVADPISSGFCGLLDTVSTVFNMGSVSSMTNIGAYYTSLFFVMSIVESACCGLVAGQISDNSIMAGTKHSIIMLIATFGIFFLLIRIGMMGF